MKIKDLEEAAGVGRITKQNQTPDVGPNEVSKQAAKWGFKVNKDGYPPLLTAGIKEDADPLSKLKSSVIKQVQATNDQELLDRIHTVLNKTGLLGRIQGVIAQETDAKKYAKVIADVIINTTGSYEEKFNFINGYPNGYVNVEKMMSGQLVTFDQLVQGNPFAQRVFAELFKFTPSPSGPGEFALAALSPRIKMRSKGDLFIDDKYIEVKSSAGEQVNSKGGRLGESGLLDHRAVKVIIEKYTKIPFPADKDMYIESTKAGSIGLVNYLKNNIADVKLRTQAANELMVSIFGSPQPQLVKAIIAGSGAQSAYLAANWKKYQEHSGWSALLIMNLTGGVARLFTKPEQMEGAIYNTSVALISKDTAKSARNILSQITLRPA